MHSKNLNPRLGKELSAYMWLVLPATTRAFALFGPGRLSIWNYRANKTSRQSALAGISKNWEDLELRAPDTIKWAMDPAQNLDWSNLKILKPGETAAEVFRNLARFPRIAVLTVSVEDGGPAEPRSFRDARVLGQTSTPTTGFCEL
jgi:hypothetical protein